MQGRYCNYKLYFTVTTPKKAFVAERKDRTNPATRNLFARLRRKGTRKIYLKPGGDPLVHLQILLGAVKSAVALGIGHLKSI